MQATSIFDGGNNKNGGTGASTTKYVGRTASGSGGRRIRLLLQFNISSIPACAMSISRASLLLNMSRGQDSLLSIHRVGANWTAGNGTDSSANPAAVASLGEPTWFHRAYNSSLWLSPGGDFAAIASAVDSNVACDLGGCVREIATAQLAADVANWRTGLLPNNGWILIGTESILQTAQRYETTAITLKAEYN